jgi:hypothetical protein
MALFTDNMHITQIRAVSIDFPGMVLDFKDNKMPDVTKTGIYNRYRQDLQKLQLLRSAILRRIINDLTIKNDDNYHLGRYIILKKCYIIMNPLLVPARPVGKVQTDLHIFKRNQVFML